jgi:primosomal protein N' (replication factor Y)
MPPFGRLAGIILSGTKQDAVFEAAHRLADAAGPLDAIGAQVWGPAPAPIARIRGRHRVRLLVKAAKAAPLQAALRAWLQPVKLAGDLRLVVDIDPQSFL